MTDRFKEQIDGVKAASKDIQIDLKERALLVKNQQSTGRIDYQIKSKIGNAQIDVKNLEKLHYIYVNEKYKYTQISEKELDKRAEKIEKVLAQFRQLQSEVSNVQNQVVSVNEDENLSLNYLQS